MDEAKGTDVSEVSYGVVLLADWEDKRICCFRNSTKGNST